MKIDYLVEKLKKQNLKKGEYAVFGSAVLAVRGIREAPNIDVIVTDRLWKELLEKNHIPNEEGFIRLGPVKISNWWFAPTRKDIPLMIREAEIIKGVPFVRLEEVRYYKSLLNREKDRNDVRLIDDFLSSTEETEPLRLGINTYSKFISHFIKKADKKLGDKIISMILFGSVARGEARGSSDIDIFIFYDDSKITRSELNRIIISTIIDLRESKQYQELAQKKIIPEIYPFLISKSSADDYLWVFLDATEEGVILKDTNYFTANLIQNLKTKITKLGGRRTKLPNGKFCWVLSGNLSSILKGEINTRFDGSSLP